MIRATSSAGCAGSGIWFRIQDGQIIEHWANRDDLGMSRQPGWVPPTPAYLLKMAAAKRRARRAGVAVPAGGN